MPCGDQVARCPACGEALDPFGDHLLSCHKNGITHRHNLLRDAWAEVLGRAGIPHAREVMIPAGLGRSSTFARERPADILLIGWDRGRDVAIDFTVCHPTTMCAFPLSEEKARRHLAQEEHGKTSRQGPQCGAAAWGFHPAAYNPWGGQGPGAKSLLFTVTKRACADLLGWSRAEKAREIKFALATALAKGVAAQLALRLKVVGKSPPADAPWASPPAQVTHPHEDGASRSLECKTPSCSPKQAQ